MNECSLTNSLRRFVGTAKAGGGGAHGEPAPGRQGGAGRRRDAWGGPRHRLHAGGGRRSGLLHRPDGRGPVFADGSARDSRGDGGAGRRARRPGRGGPRRPHPRGGGRRPDRPHRGRARAAGYPGQRHLGRRPDDRLERQVLAARYPNGPRAGGAGGPQPSDHRAARRAADAATGQRADRRGLRRPPRGLSRPAALRPGEEHGEPPGLRDGLGPA
jgi:hypothetical protein